MVITMFIIIATAMIWAFLPKIIMSWSTVLWPWHETTWRRADFARRGLVGIHRVLVGFLYPVERLVRPATFLVLRLQRSEAARNTTPALLTACGVVAFVTLTLTGLSAAGFAVAVIAGCVTAGLVRLFDVKVQPNPDGSQDGGLTLDMRPALAVLGLTIAVIVVR